MASLPCSFPRVFTNRTTSDRRGSAAQWLTSAARDRQTPSETYSRKYLISRAVPDWLQSHMASQDGTAQTLPRVLSIQSHVVHGYVGNKCAVFPLQLLGFECDPIYSVQFSNHTGYPSWKGKVFDGSHLTELLQGLKDNDLLPGYTHLLTGYIGSVSLLEHVADVTRELKAANQGNITYVCDPVMGDEGKLYVPKEMISAYQQHIVPLASIMVPNQYEAELLADCGPIDSVEAGFRACDKLHNQGPHTVVVISMSLASDPDHVTMLASTRKPQAAGQGSQRLTMKIPRIKAYFTGTGDLMASLLLAWMFHHPDDLKLAIEKAVAGLQAVLTSTARAAGPEALASDRTAQVCEARELRLIQNQRYLVDPQIKRRCQIAGSQ